MKGGKREEAWTCSWFLKTQTKQKKNTRITANPQKEQQTNSAGAEKQATRDQDGRGGVTWVDEGERSRMEEQEQEQEQEQEECQCLWVWV